MVLILKKAGVVILFVLIFVAIVLGILIKNSPAISNRTSIDAPIKIIIDAGHGGADGGATGISGINEKELNLAVATKLEKLFTDAGITVVMTRTDDDIPTEDIENQTPLERKRADLKYRKKIAKEEKADLFLSIHMNKFTQASAKGAQVFYDRTFEQSQKMATVMQTELVKGLDPNNNRKAKPAERSIYIMNQPHVPSVLVECGFISNAEEEAKLRTDEYQQKVAVCVFSGVVKYLNSGEWQTSEQNKSGDAEPPSGESIEEIIKEYYASKIGGENN